MTDPCPGLRGSLPAILAVGKLRGVALDSISGPGRYLVTPSRFIAPAGSPRRARPYFDSRRLRFGLLTNRFRLCVANRGVAPIGASAMLGAAGRSVALICAELHRRG